MTDLKDPSTDTSLRPTSARPSGPRLSSLAVVAMVVACLPCPPVSLLGAVLGLMAMGRIRQAEGRLRGRTLAKTAIVVGILVGICSLFLLTSLRDYLERGQQTAISESVHVFLTQSVNDNASGALAHWDLSNTPVRVEDVEAFGAMVNERLGPLKSLQVGNVLPSQNVSLFQPQIDAWLILEFESGTRNASGQFILIPVLETMTFQTKLKALRIEDPGGLMSIPTQPLLESDAIKEAPEEPEATVPGESGPA